MRLFYAITSYSGWLWCMVALSFLALRLLRTDNRKS